MRSIGLHSIGLPVPPLSGTSLLREERHFESAVLETGKVLRFMGAVNIGAVNDRSLRPHETASPVRLVQWPR